MLVQKQTSIINSASLTLHVELMHIAQVNDLSILTAKGWFSAINDKHLRQGFYCDFLCFQLKLQINLQGNFFNMSAC